MKCWICKRQARGYGHFDGRFKTADPRQSLRTLIEARYPIYAEADITVVSREVPQEVVAADVVSSVTAYLQTEPHHAG